MNANNAKDLVKPPDQNEKIQDDHSYNHVVNVSSDKTNEIINDKTSNPKNKYERPDKIKEIEQNELTEEEKKHLEYKKRKLERKKRKYKNRESKLEWYLYGPLFLGYYSASLFIPALLGWLYYYFVANPFLFLVNPFQWKMVNTFVFLTIPGVIIGLYLLKLLCSAYVMKFLYWLLNKVWMRAELLNAKPSGDTTDDVNIYHTRNFLLRIIKWEFTKGPFPWLAPWMFNKIGSNSIGKNCVVEDGYFCQEFLEMKDNAYIGPMSIVSSHLVEGSYGALTVKKVKMGDHAVFSAFNLIAPGTEAGDRTHVLPMSGVLKFQKLRPNSSYWGLPVQRMTRTRLKKFLKIPVQQDKSEKDKDKQDFSE